MEAAGSGRDKIPSVVARAAAGFPILERLAAHLSGQKSLAGLRVGWHCHLTWLTALAVETLLGAGAHVYLSECNPDTSEDDAVACMQEAGARVYRGQDCCLPVLEAEPQVLSDTGFVLTSAYLSRRNFPVFGACEITTSGITRARELGRLPLPVVNINQGQLKAFIENFHGVGDGLVDALNRLTGKMWSGRRAAVVGYGRVGAGVACYLRRQGTAVTVVDTDPVRRLIAHYDGFLTAGLAEAMAGSELLVTATGVDGLIGVDDWAVAADGLLVANVGHWAGEAGRDALCRLAVSCRPAGPHLEEFSIAGGSPGRARKVYLAGQGSPINVVLCSGSPEPTLIHLTTEILCLRMLAEAGRAGTPVPPGEMPVPASVERQASTLALEALGPDRVHLSSSAE